MKHYKTIGGIGVSLETTDDKKKIISLATRNWSTWITPNEAKEMSKVLAKFAKDASRPIRDIR